MLGSSFITIQCILGYPNPYGDPKDRPSEHGTFRMEHSLTNIERSPANIERSLTNVYSRTLNVPTRTFPREH